MVVPGYKIYNVPDVVIYSTSTCWIFVQCIRKGCFSRNGPNGIPGNFTCLMYSDRKQRHNPKDTYREYKDGNKDFNQVNPRSLCMLNSFHEQTAFDCRKSNDY